MLSKMKLMRQVMLLDPPSESVLTALNARHRALPHVSVGGGDIVSDEILHAGVALIEVDGSDKCLDDAAADVCRVVQGAQYHDDTML